MTKKSIATRARTLATLQVDTVRAPRSSTEHARRLVRAGSWIIAAAVVPVGLWMTFSKLSMAIVAPAFVKVDLNRRPVQHLEGGIVREVMVRDGQQVQAGDPVLKLGDVGVDADRNRLDYRIHVERAGLGRLEAEQARARELLFPADLHVVAARDHRVRQALGKETSLFTARRDSLDSQLALLANLHSRVRQEIAALEEQITQSENALALQRKDLEANRNLLNSGFISTARLAQIESVVVDYAGKLEERRSEIARAQQRLVEGELKSQSLQNDYVQAASDQLKASAARHAEIEQEVRKAVDATARQVVVAPASGEVIDLKFTSPGAVLRPGETIAEIVPSDTRLLVEAHIRPEEITHVSLQQEARIKFTAFRNRGTVLVDGKVTYVSGDRLTDKSTGQPYYSVMVLADADSLKDSGNLRLQAGMPAEVYLEGGKQTALNYITEPITSTLRKAARQL
jgi:HlyD family secretion protein